MEEENLKNILRECQLTRSSMKIKEFLNEKRGGLQLTKKIEQQRRREEDKPGGGSRRK